MVKVFFSYSHEDELYRDQLEAHLAALKHEGKIDSWHDRRILAGGGLDAEIDQQINVADIILLLVSASFLNSRYCYSIEMTRALERHQAKEAQVIPVIVRPCDWHSTPLGGLLATPKDGKAITTWPNHDEAYTDVARQIRRVVTEVNDSSVSITARSRASHSSSPTTVADLLVSTPRSGNKPKVKRDNFSAPTVNSLALRAGHHCSMSTCGVSTAGPSDSSPDKSVNIGVAAHITAASPGGPRYDPAMTPEERKSINNAIWLCQTHSRLIDVNPDGYSVSQLRQMKEAHETAQSARLEGVSVPHFNADFVALGPEIIFTGELFGVDANVWSFRVDHFFRGDLSALINFSERFCELNPYDQFVLVNALGEGRQLAGPPKWTKTQDQLQLSVPVIQSFPRIDAHNLPMDLAFDGDLVFANGDIVTVQGLDSLPQKIQMCLSTSRGEMLFNPAWGTRIREYAKEFFNTPWLPRLVKLETIRMACIPYLDRPAASPSTPLMSVRKVIAVEMLSSIGSNGSFPFKFDLDIEGIGQWSREIPIFISRDL